MEKNSTKSLLMLITAMVIYGTIGIFRKYIPLPSATLACFRGFSGAILLFVLAKVQKRKVFYNIGVKKTLWLILSGALMGLNWVVLFEAYNYTTVATATLCYYMAPTIVVLLSPIFFKERITGKKGGCALVSIGGMVLVSGFIEGGMPALSEARGILLGLFAAVLYATVVMMNKKLPGIDIYEKTILQLFAAAVVLVPYLLVMKQTVAVSITPSVIVLLLIVGLVHTGVAYALYFGSIDALKAQTVALFSYIDPITALVLSALVLHEKMTAFGAIGAVLIVGAAVVSEWKWKKKKNE